MKTTCKYKIDMRIDVNIIPIKTFKVLFPDTNITDFKNLLIRKW